jgi:pre-mRNA-splicing helicase BRR2
MGHDGWTLPVQDGPRRELLQMSGQQLEDVARVCNRYPDIQLSHTLAGGKEAGAGESVLLQVDLERELEGELRPVDAPR